MNKTTHPFLRQRLNKPRQSEGNQSLMDWLLKATRATWLLLTDVPVTMRDWRTADGKEAFLRELALREAVFAAQLPGKVELNSQES